MTRSKPFLLVVISACSLAIGALAIYRAIDTSQLEEATIREYDLMVEAAEATQHSVSVSMPGSVAAVLSGMDECGRKIETNGLSTLSCESLIETFAELIVMRFAGSGLDAYAAHRLRAGFPVGIDDLKAIWTIEQMHEYVFEEPWPETPDWDALFLKFAAALEQIADPRDKIVGIASEPRGYEVAIRTVPVTDVLSAATGVDASPALGGDAWSSRIGSTHIVWWKPPLPAGAKGNLVHVGTVGVVVAYASGDRGFLVFRFIFDVPSESWGLFSVTEGRWTNPSDYTIRLF